VATPAADNQGEGIIMRRLIKPMLMATALVGMVCSSAWAQKNEITIAYQDMVNPWRVAIADKALEKATGWTVNWRKIVGGGDVIRAMASGDIDIGEAGSAGVTTAISQGMPVELFWILEDIASAEALVVKPGIKSAKDLKGKKIATPFVSTSHYQLMYALEKWGYKPGDVKVLNMRPVDINAAWKRGDIDGTFIWNPVLAQVKDDGHVLITSGEVGKLGKPTFDGVLVTTKFAKEHPDFMVKFVKVISAADEKYREEKAKWTAKSPDVAKVSKITGMAPADVPAALDLYYFPTLKEQASAKWLGGGKNGGAAHAIMETAKFLKDQKQISRVLPDYSVAVNPTFVEKAMAK
jgi:taurine transport system substrate-binding protein